MTDWMSQLSFEDVEIGDEARPVTCPIALQRLVMEAGANRDFAPIHHDRDFARANGAPDAYANTIFLQMLFEVTLRHWMGLSGRLKRLGFRMQCFNYVGTVVTCRCRVTSKTIDGGVGLVDLDVWHESTHEEVVMITATGSATVRLPIRGSRSRTT